jgi:uncharacterized protein (DUF1499 family)
MKKILYAILGLGVFVVIAFTIMGVQSRGATAPGITNMQLAGCGGKPNCVTSMSDPGSDEHIAPFKFERGSADATWARLLEAIGAQGGELDTNAPPYMAATFSSKIFRFVDDFECLIDQDLGLIHVRAGARAGHSDFDVNRTRVESIRQALAN